MHSFGPARGGSSRMQRASMSSAKPTTARRPSTCRRDFSRRRPRGHPAPTTNGIELASQIVSEHPSTIVLILSAYDDSDYVKRPWLAGVSGYLLKTTPSDELVRLIREACEGTAARRRARGEMARKPRADSAEPSAGSPVREEEVVRLAARGIVQQVHRPSTRDQPANRGGPPQPRVRQARHLVTNGIRPLRTRDRTVREAIERLDAAELMATPYHPPPRARTRRTRHPRAARERMGTDRPTSAHDPPREADGPTLVKPRFWILQFVILAIYLVRLALTLALHLGLTSLAVEFSTFVTLPRACSYCRLQLRAEWGTGHGSMGDPSRRPQSRFRLPPQTSPGRLGRGGASRALLDVAGRSHRPPCIRRTVGQRVGRFGARSTPTRRSPSTGTSSIRTRLRSSSSTRTGSSSRPTLLPSGPSVTSDRLGGIHPHTGDCATASAWST